MTKFILWRDLELSLQAAGDQKIEDIPVGHQIRVNHYRCPAGEDTRRRLYVKHVRPMHYLAYCHNCGMAGKSKADESSSCMTLEELAKSLHVEEVVYDEEKKYSFWQENENTSSFYPDWQFLSWEDIPYLISNGPLKDFGLKYHFDDGFTVNVNEKTQTLEIPLWVPVPGHGWKHERVGVARRCFDPHYRGPKWLLDYKPGTPDHKKLFHLHNEVSPMPELLLIVEDPISAISASYLTFNTVALLRTKVGIANISKIIDEFGYSKVLIALDRDIPGKLGTVELLGKLSVLGIEAECMWDRFSSIVDIQPTAKDFKDLNKDNRNYLKDRIEHKSI